MVERDKNFEEKEGQIQEADLEVTELDDESLDGVAGGNQQEDGFSGVSSNENCGLC